MTTSLYDLRYGLRMLMKNPGFTFAALITLALGTASSTAIFSVIDGVLLHPLSYPDSEKIVTLLPTVRSTGTAGGAVAPANYIDWAGQSDVFAQVSATRGEQFSLSGSDRPERVRGTMATSNLFPLFGVAPILGGTLLPSDEQAGHNQVFPGEDPIGQFVENFGPKDEKLQVVGVVGNVRHLALETTPRPELYQPLVTDARRKAVFHRNALQRRLS